MSADLLECEGFAREGDWPLRVMRAATHERAPISTLELRDLKQAIADYRVEPGKHAGPADRWLCRGVVSEGLKDLIQSLYREGCALADLFGEEMVRVKRPDAGPAEIERLGGLRNLIGFQHVKEFLEVAERQGQFALFFEEGLIDKARLKTGMAECASLLDGHGHHGIPKAIEAQAGLREFLRNDTRIVDVDVVKGRATEGVGSLNRLTRAAYIAGEEAHAESLGASGQRYAAEGIHRAVGAEFQSAFRDKWAAIRRLAARHDVLRDAIEVSNTVLKTAMRVTGDPQSIERSIAAANTFIGKHGIALVDPRTTVLLERSGQYDAELWSVLYRRLHFPIGSSTPFLPHVTAAAERAFAREEAARGARVEHTALPQAAGTDAQKKTSDLGVSASAGEPPRPSAEHATGSSAADGTAETRTMDAKAAKGAERWILGVKACGAVLGSVLVADQLRRVWKREESQAGNGEQHREPQSRIMNYVLAAIGSTSVAALVLMKPETLERLLGGFGKSPAR